MADRELLDGWVITLEGDTAKVVSPPTGPGFAVVCQQARALPERLLFALAESLVRERSTHPQQAERDALLQALAWIDRRCPAIFLLQDLHKVHLEAAFDAGVCARAAIAKAEKGGGRQ